MPEEYERNILIPKEERKDCVTGWVERREGGPLLRDRRPYQEV